MTDKKKRPLAGGRFPSRAAEVEAPRRTVAERAPSPGEPDESPESDARPSSTRRFVSENLWKTGSAPSRTRTTVKDAAEKPSSAKEKILRALKKLHPME